MEAAVKQRHTSCNASVSPSVAEGTNPCRFVLKCPAERREQFLTNADFERLSRRTGLRGEVARGGARGQRGNPAPDAGGLPQERDPGLAVGRRQSRCAEVDARGRENGPPYGVAVALGGEGAGETAEHLGEPLGAAGAQTEHASDRHRQGLGRRSRHGRKHRRALRATEIRCVWSPAGRIPGRASIFLANPNVLEERTIRLIAAQERIYNSRTFVSGQRG